MHAQDCFQRGRGTDRAVGIVVIGRYNLFFQKNIDLISIHYAGGEDIFHQGPKGYIFTKDGFKNLGSRNYPKNYNGSFDHPLSLKILNEEADIVCTNPPFSMAKNYWKIICQGVA